MKLTTLCLSSFALVASTAWAGGPTYVGGGRYTCHDDSAGCAIIKQNNRRITQDEIDARKREPYRTPDPTFSHPTGHEGPPVQRWLNEDRSDNTGKKR